ncbi:ankyrin repeat domain-containing protein [Legionella brunensis]|uniref:Uncharacterized protein n=1 Tax=Legionella brunensis TaxID=29422 RepID=A0A0W0S3Y5_9GAMM|nr:ankyrin repeat domain-containing protein [Legionella brunensis]KTC78042.1 hypothetical protein Lbru_2334 [Legionella brunensis]
MPANDATKKLIAEILPLIEKNLIKEGKKILHCIQEGNFNEALLLACKHCEAGDKAMLRLIKILVRSKSSLPIDVNTVQSSNGFTPLYYAAYNCNVDLFIALIPFNAQDPQAHELLNENFTREAQILEQYYDKEFLNQKQELVSEFENPQKLPDRKSISDDIRNGEFDFNRMIYILKIITFLQKSQDINHRFKALPKTISPVQAEIIKTTHVSMCRKLIEKMCLTIQNLSSDTRIKYSKLFGPAPFTWINFDQLGGLVIDPSADRLVVLPFLDMQREFSRENMSVIISTAELFLREGGERQAIIEEALQDIIQKDFTLLKEFFTQICREHLKPSNNNAAVKPVTLTHIKAITGYVNDMDNFIKLINLVNYTGKIKPPVDTTKLQIPGLLGGFKTSAERYKNRFDLSTKMGRHAALRMLQSIGELITGKNFSRFLLDLDETIDWRAFISLRDGITHQDEGNKKYKIDQLLANKAKLEKITGKELSDFWERLVKLLILREKKLGSYSEDPQSFWQSILKTEINSDQLVEEEEKKGCKTVPEPERRVSKEDEIIFIKALEQCSAPIEVIEDCHKIFSGSKRVNKLEQGAVFKYLPKDKLGNEKHKALANIMKMATSKPSSTEEERNRKRMEAHAASQRREQERKSRFKGLEELRLLAEDLNQSMELIHMLSPLKRVEAAMEALINIKEFLEEKDYIVPESSYKTMEEWDKYHLYNGGPSLVKRLGVDYELNDAIEYNAGQLLQHLETIRGYPEARNCAFLTINYSDLRSFRNYLEHGDPLYDSLHQGAAKTDYRQQLIAPMVIKLVFELLPALTQLRENMKFKKFYGHEGHQNPLVSEKEALEWQKVMSQNYGKSGFFAVENSKDEVTEETGLSLRHEGSY